MESPGTSSKEENLKQSLHYYVGKNCLKVAEEYEVTFSKEFIAILADLVYGQIGGFAKDLEMFANHAKRSTINAEDVKLLARKSKSLYDHIQSMGPEATTEKTVKKRKKEV